MGLEKKFYTVDEIISLTGSSRATIYRLRGRGVIQFRKFGGRTVIPRLEFDQYMDDLPIIPAEAQPHPGRVKSRA
ncbi:DNA-binding protein [Mesorhizobium sp. M6A.T.Ce.TU.002.03.1.1]|uniref:helix-turn-helix domain-containing protein n=1 Tax=Mesorhizobium sp. M6A.T.Ce.TU.002.03.1.1 TaxID=2496782 RepID=UPI000FCBFA3E|nr:helix-turn-helix domain-containing protein [Mesorhizobium sp. M6A.T.Ce.TU.002.03.1.1]RUU46621.1 DNA-binding protein [Mesorhizobium sp. M6A.T.Ce.TU.002.03.1.1]